MMALRRPDAWASGDRALAVSYFENTDLDDVPGYKDLDAIANRWIPYRVRQPVCCGMPIWKDAK